MKRTLSFIALAAVLVVSCTKTIGSSSESQPANVVIDPVITRALNLNFKTGNQIGLDIQKSDKAFHAQNALLTYDGSAFTGDLKWYAQGGEVCSLLAYYPYSQAGFPESFSVALDQSEGTDASDFMVATAENVYPTSAPVTMNFKHKFAQITINVKNTAGASLDAVKLSNIIPDAIITNDPEAGIVASVNPEGQPSTIKAEPIEAGKKYCAIVVPQTFESLEVSVSVKDGSTLASGIKGAELKPGFSYTISVEVLADQVKVSIGGEINNWENGGDLGGDGDTIAQVQFEEDLIYGYFTYDNVRYNIVKLADGKWWMAQNLRYVPAGKTVSSDATADDGIWYPAANADKVADPALAETLGLLYDYKTAFNVDEVTVENAASFEGCQGICPKGWHIPTNAEMTNLVGHNSNSAMINTGACYYDESAKGAKIPVLNEAGFNWTFVGIRNKTSITGAGSYSIASYNGVYGTMSYLLGSTFYKDAYKDGVLTNIQFYGMMSSYNASNEKVTVGYTNFLSGYSLRCVRN